MKYGRRSLTREIVVLEEERVPVPRRPHEVPHEMAMGLLLEWLHDIFYW